mmetsp:Transcript_4071/g.10555  ORF Transcript_4071/g.10555 Transcript_4071/m.10555 type:complete len:391 (+) Transcript_4071:2-1174(+)
MAHAMAPGPMRRPQAPHPPQQLFQPSPHLQPMQPQQSAHTQPQQWPGGPPQQPPPPQPPPFMDSRMAMAPAGAGLPPQAQLPNQMPAMQRHQQQMPITMSPPMMRNEPSQASMQQMHWTVHDGQFFAAHLREKRPRAPVERRHDEEQRRRHNVAVAELEHWKRQNAAAADGQPQSSAPMGGPPPPFPPRLDAAPYGPPGATSAGGMPIDAAMAAEMAGVGLRTAGGSMLYKSLLDLMPTPIYVRTAEGQLLFSNRLGSITAGEPPGMLPAPWQVTPQVAPVTHPSRMMTGRSADKEGEIDLPRDQIPAGAIGEPLPPPSQGYSVLIQGRSAPIRNVLTMHRIPFWFSASDGGAQSAVVMYVAPVAGHDSQKFFPASNGASPRDSRQMFPA